MTAPLVPPGVNLRGLPWMRLDTSRLLDSDLFALSTGDEFKAAVALWCKSWTQEPAASLPTDDRVLAHLSGAGSKWKKVKAMALRGWVLADDGRLYHQVVAEQALQAWEERQEFRAEVDSRNERKRKEREERAAMFEALKAAGHDLAWNTPTGKLRELSRDLSNPPVTGNGHTGHGDSHGLDGTGRDGTGISTPDTPPERTRDARTPDEVVGQFEGHESPTALQANPVAIQLAVALNRAGFRCTSINPDLVAYAQQGGTVDHVTQIAALPDCAGKPATYVLRFALRELLEPAKPMTSGATDATDPHSRQRGESVTAHSARVNAMLDEREREQAEQHLALEHDADAR